MAAVLLVAGLRERTYTAWAAAAGGGVVSSQAWPREQVVVDRRRDDQIPPGVDVPPEAWHRLLPTSARICADPSKTRWKRWTTGVETTSGLYWTVGEQFQVATVAAPPGLDLQPSATPILDTAEYCAELERSGEPARIV